MNGIIPGKPMTFNAKLITKKDGVEFENAGPPTSILVGRRDSPLNKNKQKVSFEKSDSSSGRSLVSGKTARERWLWAYSRIVQVGNWSQRW